MYGTGGGSAVTATSGRRTASATVVSTCKCAPNAPTNVHSSECFFPNENGHSLQQNIRPLFLETTLTQWLHPIVVHGSLDETSKGTRSASAA